MKINIKEALEFFDEATRGRGHASAIVGVIGEDLNASAFKHYMEAQGAEVQILDTSVQQGLPGRGWGTGKRLDRWIYLKEKNGAKKLYQCEIKNWSATAIGGYSLGLKASEEEICKVARRRWKQQLGDFSQDKGPNYISKVFAQMKIPAEYQEVRNVQPLMAYWMPVSHAGKLTPFFSVSKSKIGIKFATPFKALNIFSVSLYLRELMKQKHSHIDLDMPNAEKRIEILNSLIA